MVKIQKQNYNLFPREIFEKYGSGEKGLVAEEARKRLGEYGQNKIQKKQDWKWLKLIFGQFDDALVWILLVAAGLAFAFSEYRDTTIILIIVFLNSAIGFFQEWRAERILEGIKKLTTDKALVVRGGENGEIDAKFLVPGDIVSISSGDNIPADGLLLEAYDLRINSFVFTGESRPKTKTVKVISENNISLADIDNMVFLGETVATGEAKFLVTATGMSTELGKIANLTQEVKDDPTPLQLQMRRLGKDVAILSVIIGAVVIIGGQYFKMSLYQNFIFALALSVSVVPEGLPAAISVALSFGMRKLLKDNVLAKKLNAVETLGSVGIICTDKTGTITRNELTVVKMMVGKKIITIDGEGYNPEGSFCFDGKKINPDKISGLEMLCRIGTLCNSATLLNSNNQWKILGDPTEGALIVAGRKFNGRDKYYELGEKKITENPFSSERMRMSVIYENSKVISYVKGSPDVMIELCKFILIDGKKQRITEQHKEEIRKKYNEMSSEALRVLAFGYRDLDQVDRRKYAQEAERELVWTGMMAMIDPPRSDVKKAIFECRELGIRVIMITGDYELTAQAIAKKIGLFESSTPAKGVQLPQIDTKSVINGKNLDLLSDKELYQKIKDGVCVFARIAPEQKLRIANVLKKHDQVIAMTGDGVNDAPALRRADIGVAMGIMGTDVSKEASDMILLDDNFSSIVGGIREGRTIFSNLKKFVHYVFTSNASEVLTVVFGVILGIPSPISAVQILAIDLGTDVFPSFSLGLEPSEPDKDGNQKKANNAKQSILGFSGFRRIVYLAIIMATGAVIAFITSMMRGGWSFGEKIDPNAVLYIKSTSAAYAVLSMTQMANLLQSRSERLSPFQLGFFKNKYLILSILISLGILLLFMYLPFCQEYLRMLPIDGWDWTAVIISTLAVFFWEEGRKKDF